MESIKLQSGTNIADLNICVLHLKLDHGASLLVSGIDVN